MNKLTGCCKKSKYAAKKEMGQVDPVPESEEVTAALEKLNALEIHYKKTKKAFRAFQKANKAAISSREKAIKVLEATKENASGDCAPEFNEMCEFMEATKSLLEHQSAASKQHFTEPLAMLLVEIDTCVRLRSKYKKARLAYETNYEYLEKQRSKNKSEGKIRTAQKELDESEAALQEISQKIVTGVDKIEEMRDTDVKNAMRTFLDECNEMYPGHVKKNDPSEEPREEKELHAVTEEEKSSEPEGENKEDEEEKNEPEGAMADVAKPEGETKSVAEEAMKKESSAEGTGLKVPEVQEAN